MAEPRWLPLESNPEVMNQFIHSLGVPKNWQLVDVLGLDPELLLMVPQPALALILLYPISDKVYDKDAQGDNGGSSSVYFMKQTIHNACGTIALLHAIGNNVDNLKLEGYLKEFFDSTKDLSPAEKGAKLEKDETIMKAHTKTAEGGQTKTPNLEDEVDNHFLAFVNVNGNLYELDGTKPSPKNLGPTSPDTLLADAAVACKKYMERDPDEVRFTMIALAATD